MYLQIMQNSVNIVIYQRQKTLSSGIIKTAIIDVSGITHELMYNYFLERSVLLTEDRSRSLQAYRELDNMWLDGENWTLKASMLHENTVQHQPYQQLLTAAYPE